MATVSILRSPYRIFVDMARGRVLEGYWVNCRQFFMMMLLSSMPRFNAQTFHSFAGSLGRSSLLRGATY